MEPRARTSEREEERVNDSAAEGAAAVDRSRSRARAVIKGLAQLL